MIYIGFIFMSYRYYNIRNIIFLFAMISFLVALYKSVLKERSLKNLKGYSKFLVNFLALWSIISIGSGIYDHGIVGIGGSILFDVFQYIFLLSGVLFINSSKNQIKKFVQRYISLLFPIIIAGLIGFDSSLALEGRGVIYRYSSPISTMLQATSVVTYLLIIIYSYVRNNRIVVAANLILLVFLFTGFYFLKRYVFVDVITFVIISNISSLLFLKSKSYGDMKGRRKPVIIMTISIMALIFVIHSSTGYFNILGEMIIKRFSMSAGNLDKFDRLQEARMYLSEATGMQLTLGTGLGSVYSMGVRPWTYTASHLHLGYPNLIFKGGIILFMVISFTLLRNLYLVRTITTPAGKYFVFCSTALVLITLTHSPLWGWWPTSLFFGITLFATDIAKTIK